MPTPAWTKTVILIFSGLMFALSLLTGKSIDKDGFRLISLCVTGTVFLLTAYEKWAWRWPVIRKGAELAGRPIIHGTWRGELEYQRDAHGQPGTIPFYLSVTQTLSSVQIRSFVSTSESASVTATIEHPSPTKRQLVFAYRSEAPYPDRDNNRPHDGTCVLALVGIPVQEIFGSYYNDRGRAGKIKMNGHSKKHAESFEHAERLTYSN